MASFWDTPTKDVPRRIVMQKRRINSQRRRVARTAFLFPAAEALCALAGAVSGLLGPRTRIIAAERNTSVARKAKVALSHIYPEWRPEMWTGEVNALGLTNVLDGDTLDFSYLDFCAALNNRTAEWTTNELAPNVSPGGTVAITLARQSRASKYMQWWNASWRRKNSSAAEVHRWAEQYIVDANIVGRLADTTTFYDDSRYTYADTFTPNQQQEGWNRRLTPEYHEASATALSSFMILFPYHTFDLEACVEYRNHPNRCNSMSMTAFVLTNLQKTDELQYPPSLVRALQNQLRDETKRWVTR